MRTTLDLDDDLLTTAKRLAHEKGVSLGQVISELARQSLRTEVPMKVRNGVPLFVPKAGAQRPDLSTVNALRDQA